MKQDLKIFLVSLLMWFLLLSAYRVVTDNYPHPIDQMDDLLPYVYISPPHSGPEAGQIIWGAIFDAPIALVLAIISSGVYYLYSKEKTRLFVVSFGFWFLLLIIYRFIAQLALGTIMSRALPLPGSYFCPPPGYPIGSGIEGIIIDVLLALLLTLISSGIHRASYYVLERIMKPKPA